MNLLSDLTSYLIPDFFVKRIKPAKVASTEYFKAMIHRERALADRNGRVLSLLVYSLANKHKDEIDQLVDILSTRIRETDDLGWIEPEELGILLRQTPYEGATGLARNLDAHLVMEKLTFPWHILSYPEGRTSSTPASDHHIGARLDALHRPLPVESPMPAPQMLALVAAPIPWWKRLTDILLSTLALFALAPVLLLITLVIVIVSPGPVLFRQERIGYLGRRFMCLKFRTMKLHAPTDVHQAHLQHLIQSDTPMKKLDDSKDHRIIPLGRMLRACALDELPQLFNVIRGDMSLVGPRPCLAYEFETFLRWHKRRFDTLPGLTGLWQVSGKNKTTFGEMMRLDIAYERHRSFLFDLWIIAKTPLVVAEQILEAANLPSKEHIYESAH